MICPLKEPGEGQIPYEIATDAPAEFPSSTILQGFRANGCLERGLLFQGLRRTDRSHPRMGKPGGHPHSPITSFRARSLVLTPLFPDAVIQPFSPGHAMTPSRITPLGRGLALTAALLGWMFDGMEMGLF